MRRGHGFRRSPSGEISWLMGPAVSGGNMNSLRPNEGISLFERFSILLLIKIQIIKSNPKKEVF